MKNFKYMLFIGSGFSRGEGGPSWMDLRDWGVYELTGHISRRLRNKAWDVLVQHVLSNQSLNVKQLAEYKEKPEFVMWVLNQYYNGEMGLVSFLKRRLKTEVSRAYVEAIQFCRDSDCLLLTTEFDSLFEQAMRLLWHQNKIHIENISDGEQGRSVRVIYWDNQPIVIELHGSIQYPSSLVCQPEQVYSWQNNNAVVKVLHWLNQTRYAIFWGFSGADPDIREFLDSLVGRGLHFDRTFFVDLEQQTALKQFLDDSSGFNHVKWVQPGRTTSCTWNIVKHLIN